MTLQFENFKNLLDQLERLEINDVSADKFMREDVDNVEDWKEYQKSDEYNELEDEDKQLVNQFIDVMDRAEMVEHYGGEGQGDAYYTVWFFPSIDLFVKFYGYYASHSGSEYEGMCEVKPKEVTVTQYDEV